MPVSEQEAAENAIQEVFSSKRLSRDEALEALGYLSCLIDDYIAAIEGDIRREMAAEEE